MDREISPPPLKRRKVEPSNLDLVEALRGERGQVLGPEDMNITKPCAIRIFSWNINGIQALLPASKPPITTFFKPTRKPNQTSSRTVPGSTGPESEAPCHGNPLRAFLQRHRWPEVLFLQELKINPSDQKTPAALLCAINTSTGSQNILVPQTKYTLDVNLPRDKHNARGFGGKLYGVGTLLREDFANQHVAAIRHADWDLEGRVTIVELHTAARDTIPSTIETSNPRTPVSDSRRPLALLNIYAVNGTTAPYRSPDTGKPAGTRHDHKLAFHARLRAECIDLERRGFGVVVAGDLNIARGRLDGHPGLRTFPRQHCVNRADFNRKFFGEDDNARAEAYLGERSRERTGDEAAGFDGVDVFRALKGRERRYTYHPRGGDEWGSSCDRVDFIVASKALCDAGRVVDTDILDSPQERGTSDHVPLWVKVKLEDAASE